MELLVLFFLAAVYFFPAIHAGSKHHPNSVAIFLTNLLFGWTLVGWGVALIWSVKV